MLYSTSKQGRCFLSFCRLNQIRTLLPTIFRPFSAAQRAARAFCTLGENTEITGEPRPTTQPLSGPEYKDYVGLQTKNPPTTTTHCISDKTEDVNEDFSPDTGIV